MPPLIIVSSNVLSGGARHFDALLARLLALAPDILCLSEVLPRTAGRWQSALIDHGFMHHWCHAPTDPKTKCLLVASRLSLDEVHDQPVSPQRWRHLIVPDDGLHLLFAHCWTDAPDPQRKLDKWQWMCDRAASLQGDPWLLMGNLNTGDKRDRHDTSPPFTGESHFVRLTDQIGIDLWRSRNPHASEWSWLSGHALRRGLTHRGFRLDHAIASRSLAERCAECRYEHTVRTDGLTDHSAIIVRLEPAQR